MSLSVLLKNPKILLIGGGMVAAQKAKVLSENDIVFHGVSLEFTNEIKSYLSSNECKAFATSDLQNYDYVIDATGNMEVTNQVLEAKKKRFFLLNVVDVPHLCDFYFQALVNVGKLQISVSSNGSSPTLAKKIRDYIKTAIPSKMLDVLEYASLQRDQGIIDADTLTQKANGVLAKVFIIGCGPGDAELLTLRAYRCMQTLQVALVDHLVSQEIIDMLPSTCEIIDVGKQKGLHKKEQDTINALLLQHAYMGKQVGRLKGGDPYLFGRGAEEILFLQKHHFANIEVIPGISSAISGATCAGIPVTHRDMAKSFSVVTAHTKGNSICVDWVDKLLQPSHTTVVLMGLSRIDAIVKEAHKIGVRSDLPCAVIFNASRKNQRVVKTTLEEIQAVPSSKDPALIVFGEVVRLGDELPKYVSSQGYFEMMQTVSNEARECLVPEIAQMSFAKSSI